MNLASTTLRLESGLEGLEQAAAILRAGGLVAMPTETVYGLAADATNPAAVAKIYAAKGRPSFNPLIAHVADLEEAWPLGHFNEAARRLAAAFWPGPLTLVVPAGPETPVCELARAGLPSVAIRLPSHPIARELIRRTGRPLAAPSANRSGHVSPTSAEHVLSDLEGRLDAVILDAPSNLGVESTIVACLDGAPLLLRPGGISREQLWQVEPALTLPGSARDHASRPVSPGLLESHYAPNLPVRLGVSEPGPDEAFLAFGPYRGDSANPVRVFQLSATKDLGEAAANLYAGLRWLDRTGAKGIAIAPIPENGLGEAINDRLRRAAAR